MTLTISNLSLNFADKTVLQDFSFELHQGEIASFLGRSGCGKTTALRCISGFETPKSGTIFLDNQCFFEKSANKTYVMPAHQRQIGMVFQDYALFPHLTVGDNIAFGLNKLSSQDKQKRIDELLELIGLTGYKKHYPYELSGGQQQRIALARALAPRPKLILLDEPFSNLDVDLRTNLSKEVRKLLKQEQVSAILVTHDQHEAFAIADKVGMMADGKLQQWGTPYELYHQPKTVKVAEFIGDGVLLKAKLNQQLVQTAVGNIPCKNQSSLQNNQQISVLIRPQNVQLSISDDTQKNAIIVDRDFKGSHYLYTLTTLDTDEILQAQTSVNNLYQVGLPVTVHVNEGWAIVD